MKNIITISGQPGCGKSTIAKILAKKLNYQIISSGERFREIAKQHDMNIVDFNTKYLPHHPEVDIDIDNYFVDFASKNDNLIIPTRVVGHLLKKSGVDTFNVYLSADSDTRLERIVSRENSIEVDKTKADLVEREDAERLRYKELYNIDINDLSMYNLVIYTHFLPEKIGFIKIIFRGEVEYIESNNTLPEVISGIIVEKYNELINK